ncbi:MAG: hypothetical protein HOU01_17275, partial [Streptomycetaceae bacterium]|nr:hypothetical protein [Streptomycetaceae bacterium]
MSNPAPHRTVPHGGTSADLVVVGARVLTQDPDRPFASAVAVRGGRIVAVGDDA